MNSWLFTKTPLVFLTQSIWRDEAFSYLLAKKNFLDIIILSAKDFSPPLYYLILHFWIKFFGSGEIALRILSLIFFWMTAYVFFLFLTDILKIKTSKAFFYLIFFIINPLQLYYGFEARSYSMFAFFSLSSFYFLFKNNKKLYFLTTILGLYTHYFMIFVLAIQYFIFRSKKQIIAFLYFLPWLMFIFANKNLIFSSFWINSFTLKDFINFIGNLYTGYEYDFKFFDKNIFKLSLFLLAIIIGGFISIKQKNKKEKILINTLFYWGLITPFLIILISFIKPIFLPRYLIFSNIGLLLLIIYFIDRYHVVLKIIIISLLFITTINYNKLQIEKRKKIDFKKPILEIKRLMKKNDYLYVTNELDFFTAQYYLNENQVYIWGKNHDEIPDYVGKVLIPKEKIKNLLPFYPQKAFILTSWGEYSIQAIY